ncbi:hypothetical protein [Caulobacter sp. UNC358MFTsu5.1]|uniref:hypothetical protein n=1 Tax=Caulobacter sp. UNC358MFTsu5.1 TaxID=1449049 RepID=UPI0012DD5404|nr:hypothetical protein [Caulobacter sp. UNC358MFTsu5.1]
MIATVRRALRAIAASPRWRTALSVLLAISTGLVSGALINEITIENRVNWLFAFKSYNLYILIFFALLNYLYYDSIHKIEVEILKFSDSVFCIAYVRSQLLPDAVEAAKIRIRNGDTVEFEAAMASFKKVLR